MRQSCVWVVALWVLLAGACGRPLMIEEKEELLSVVRSKDMAVVFYGQAESEAFREFSRAIPTSDRLFSSMEFVHVPSGRFKLNRPVPSVSLFRRIGSGEWTVYHGAMAAGEIERWVRRQVSEQLPELRVEELDGLLRGERRGLVVLDYGEFELIRTKVYLQEFCDYQRVPCFKVTRSSPLLSVVSRLLAAEPNDQGISRVAAYDPHAQRFQLYPKDAWFLTREELFQLYEGAAGIVPADIDGRPGDLEIELHYEEQEI